MNFLYITATNGLKWLFCLEDWLQTATARICLVSEDLLEMQFIFIC